MPMPALAFTCSMASAATFSSGIDLGYGWNKVGVIVPTMPSGSDIYFQAAESLNGTYRRIFHAPSSSSATPGAFFITSGVTNCFVPLLASPQFIKVELPSAPTANASVFKFICTE